jgi:hypothetical protein
MEVRIRTHQIPDRAQRLTQARAGKFSDSSARASFPES